jgi:glycosyltransferase involved in cell wall biosynthesis
VKIAFIVQRYGADILGGSEYHCRLIAERMAQRHQVDVLTTCARDYITWKNEYPEGVDRDLESFNRYSDRIFNYPHTDADELEWLKQQGPWCPALIEYLERQQRQYDVLIFFTYLYAPTLLGMKVNPAKSILVPTAHDEPAIRLRIYKELFASARAIAFNTDSERRFLNSMFELRPDVEETVGCGVDLPQSRPHGRQSTADDAAVSTRGGRDDRRESVGREAGPDDDAAGAGDDPEPGSGNRRVLRGRGQIFRRRHRLYDPILLYGGRIDPGKGCEELFQYFNGFVKSGGDGTLVLMGVKLMPLPEDPSVRFAGMLSEQERAEALEAATVVMVPSPHESLSLLALESFSVGTPILANARSEVLVDHCLKSNAGLFYADQDEFTEALKLLLTDDRLRAGMGKNGRAYIKQNYRWDVIMQKYDRLISKLRG